MLVANDSIAEDSEVPARTIDPPITVYTSDAGALRPGGPAGRLTQKAREQGVVRVIVMLRIVMRMEHTLSPTQVSVQRRALRVVQDAVAGRVLGSTTDPATVRFEFIPAMSLFVNAAQLGRLFSDPQVVSIEEDVPMPPLLGQSIPLVHADDVFAKGVNGIGRVVAVLDTGVAKVHPMISGKVVSEACYSTTNAAYKASSVCPGGVARSTAVGSGVNCPVGVRGCDHGTHVASIAAGCSAKYDGVARAAKIIAIQVFSRRSTNAACSEAPPCATAFTTDLILGLQRVHALRNTFKIAAANISLGGRPFASACDAAMPALTAAITNLRNAGIAPVIASGNQGQTGKIAFPSCISTAIAIGNTTKTDLVNASSNHSPRVNLLAPGTGINAAVPADASCAPNNGIYCAKTGTSMASPHVAGAFALLKNAKPTATVNQILEALICSGKTVDQRATAGNPVEVDPKPRIDLLGAYNFLRKPPNVLRSWKFDTLDDGKDWTPFRGKWVTSGGLYKQSPIMAGWIASSVANCNNKLQVVARIRRGDPTPANGTSFPNSGIIIKATLNHTTEIASGYFVAYNSFPSGGARGEAWVWRLDQYNLETRTGGVEALCWKYIPIAVGGFNTIKVVSKGSSHTFSLNGKTICTVDDANYASGPVMPMAFIPASTAGHSFAIDTLQITSLDTAAPEAGDPVMNPAAFAPKAIPTGTSPEGTRAR